MTTIFWCDNRLYADSKMFKDGKSFESLTKIQAFDKPFRIKHKKKKVDDLTLGWVCTGAVEPAEKFVRWLGSERRLKEEGLSDSKMSLLESALFFSTGIKTLGLYSPEHDYEVILIGRKANYSLVPCAEDENEALTIYPHSKKWMLGSGGQFIVHGLKKFKTPDPLRLVHYACALDQETSGGLIDIWELKKNGRKVEFQRAGINRSWNHIPIEKHIRNIMRPTVIDYIHQP